MAEDIRFWVVCEVCRWRGRRTSLDNPCGAKDCDGAVVRTNTRLKREPGLVRQRVVYSVRPETKRGLSAAEGALLLDRVAADPKLLRALKRHGVESLVITPPAAKKKARRKRRS